jgi:hypothetical protein
VGFEGFGKFHDDECKVGSENAQTRSVAAPRLRGIEKLAAIIPDSYDLRARMAVWSGMPKPPQRVTIAVMFAAFLADTVLVVHLAFILFVVFGAFAARRHPQLLWLHLPALAWGVYIEFSGGICPLTPLENRLRLQAGEAGYSGGFIEHYLLALIYPDGLTREIQIGLGVAALLVNLWAYARLRRPGRRKDAQA